MWRGGDYLNKKDRDLCGDGHWVNSVRQPLAGVVLELEVPMCCMGKGNMDVNRDREEQNKCVKTQHSLNTRSSIFSHQRTLTMKRSARTAGAFLSIARPAETSVLAAQSLPHAKT